MLFRSVASYEGAEAAYAAYQKTPTGRQRQPKEFGFALGGHSKSVTWVRREPTGSIVFRLYNTDVVTWHPDDSFEVDNYGTVTTGQFARRFTPAGITLHHPTSVRGQVGGYKGIRYHTAADTGWWGANLCSGDVVRFVPQGDGVWLPDEDTLDTMCFPVLDHSKCREITKRYHLKDFATWLSMAPRHMRIEHDCWSVDDCAAALEKRDFTLASMFLPLTDVSKNHYGRDMRDHMIPIITSHYDRVVTSGVVDRLKVALWDREDLFGVEEFKTIPRAEYDRRMVRVRTMRNLGLVGIDEYGLAPW